MNTLYVVASSPEQRQLRLPAAQLYVGELFSSAITHARRFAKREADVRILSPRFGLLSQARLLDPYDLQLDELNANDSAALVEVIRGELPRRGTLPLRFVVLGSDAHAALFRAAVAGTRFEAVPIRAPLSPLSYDQQLQWLQAATWPIECDAPMPATERLSPSENERLRQAARAGAVWWSEQLMKEAPPPEPTLFANALALEIYRSWEEIAQESRGEWPEDIVLCVTWLDAQGPIAAALQAVGLNTREWWKREGGNRHLQISMRFSMASITVQDGDQETLIFS